MCAILDPPSWISKKNSKKVRAAPKLIQKLRKGKERKLKKHVCHRNVKSLKQTIDTPECHLMYFWKSQGLATIV